MKKLLVILLLVSLSLPLIAENINFKCRKDIYSYLSKTTKGYKQIKSNPDSYIKKFKNQTKIDLSKNHEVLVVIIPDTTVRLNEIGHWDFQIISNRKMIISYNNNVLEVSEILCKYNKRKREITIYSLI